MLTSFPLFPGLSAATALSLSTDGNIPAKLWAEARAFDAAYPVANPRAVKIGKVTLHRVRVIKIMARAMADAIAARGLVDIRDMERLGLTRQQIADGQQEALAIVLASNPALAELSQGEAS